MRIRVSDPALLEDLKDFLESAECRIRRVGPVTIDVAMPRAPSPEQASREIAIYLKTWQAMNRGSYARIVAEGTEEPSA
jgi:hypothetical protein